MRIRELKLKKKNKLIQEKNRKIKKRKKRFNKKKNKLIIGIIIKNEL